MGGGNSETYIYIKRKRVNKKNNKSARRAIGCKKNVTTADHRHQCVCCRRISFIHVPDVPSSFFISLLS